MAKFYGKVAYVTTEKTSPGRFDEKTDIREYYGDEISWGSRWRSGDKINDDIEITNQLSIVADPFAMNNFRHIRWVEWLGTKWAVVSVQIERPRLILSLGGVYNASEG